MTLTEVLRKWVSIVEAQAGQVLEPAALQPMVEAAQKEGLDQQATVERVVKAILDKAQGECEKVSENQQFKFNPGLYQRKVNRAVEASVNALVFSGLVVFKRAEPASSLFSKALVVLTSLIVR